MSGGTAFVLFAAVLVSVVTAAPAVSVAPGSPLGCVSPSVTSVTNFTETEIPDVATTTSTIEITGAGPYLRDVDMTTFIEQNFPADLDITLESPSGTSTVITTDNADGNDDVFNGTLWDDFGGTPATDYQYVTLSVATPLVPEGAMGAFIGEDPNGTWTLTIVDDVPLDDGLLTSWSLDIATLPTNPSLNVTTAVGDTTPAAINDQTTTIATLDIAGAPTLLDSISLFTDITHPANAELDIFLTSPTGTVVTLSTENGDSKSNGFAGTTWNDKAPVPVTEVEFVDGVNEPSLIPEEAMSAFVGEDPNGTWTLEITDGFNGNEGTLNEWSLSIDSLWCQSPVAADDTLSVDQGGEASGNVLTNDSDADGDTLIATKLSDPAHGSAVLDPDGSFTYTHDGSDTISDSFTYESYDGGLTSNVATVHITVIPPNEPPLAVDDPVEVRQGRAVSGNVLGNDSDADGDQLTAVKVTDPGHGTVNLQPDGSFTYTHDGSQTTADSFTYLANDGQDDSNPATVLVTIIPNNPPVAIDDSAFVNDGESVSGNVLTNDTDQDGDALSAIRVSGPSSGQVVLDSDGSFTYTHDGSDSTEDSFTYVADDGLAESNVATVTIDITQVKAGGPYRAVILGGSGVVSDAVAAELASLAGAPSDRLAGGDRFATAAAISAATFSPGVEVFIAVGDNFPDALAGGPAAAKAGGPILLVNTTSIPAATANELTRLMPSQITILGGTGVVSDAVAAQLAAFTTGSVERLAGSDRFTTAVEISKDTFPSGATNVYIAVGDNFPDALAGGPAASVNDGPILLVNTGSIPASTAAEINRLDPATIWVLGGSGVISDEVFEELDGFPGFVERVAGNDRYTTATAISQHAFATAPLVYVAVGNNFPDALAGVPVAGINNAPILLVTTSTIPGATRNEITRLRP